MAYHALVSVFCPDRVGLVAGIAARLFDLGANLGDASFTVLGEGAEFSSLCELPDTVDTDAVTAALADLPELAGARIEVHRFDLGPLHAATGRVTHRVECTGHDRPGLVARLAEVFGDFDANIVRMTCQTVPGDDGDAYTIRFAVCIPERRAEACLAALGNTAEGLGQTLRWEIVAGPA